jgi:hypothetical protein
MLFGSVRRQLREHFEDIKPIVMAGAAGLVVIALVCASFIPLFALVHRPQHHVLQHNLDRYHAWLNYGDTVPKMDTFTGIGSAVPIGKGGGWINKLSNPKLIFNTNFILDYNKCLTRACYTMSWNPGFHTRLSLCRHPPYNKRVGFTPGPSDEFTIDIRKFGSNERGDVKSTDRGIALTWNEYVSLVKNFKWVESYFLSHGRQFPNSVNDPNKYITNRIDWDSDNGTDILHPRYSNSTNVTNLDGQVKPIGSVVY